MFQDILVETLPYSLSIFYVKINQTKDKYRYSRWMCLRFLPGLREGKSSVFSLLKQPVDRQCVLQIAKTNVFEKL